MQQMFPSPTAGDGRVRRQYVHERDGQGTGRKLRRVSCRQCGFPGANLDQHDSSGGSLSGDGAGGEVSSGDQTYNTGAGCPLCFSKNYHGSARMPDEFSQSYQHEVLR